jgi:hypothetical protein
VRAESEAVKAFAPVLLEQLRADLDLADLVYRQRPARLGGGKFSSVYAFSVTPAPPGWTGSFVLRVVGSPDQARLEAALHDAATAPGLRAPRVLLCGTETAPDGAGFLVIERFDGRAFLRGVEPWRFALDLPKVAMTWPRRLAGVVHALAGVDPDVVRRRLTGAAVPADLARPGRHLRAVSAALAQERALDGVVAWLQDNCPAPPERCGLVHGDLWPANVFFDKDAIGLIDWTRGGIDDPALDVGFAKVGFALMPEPFPPPPPIRQLVTLTGRSIAHRISEHCDHLVGGPQRVAYFEALRCAVELADVVNERSQGRQPGWRHGVPALVRHLEGIVRQPIAFT